jgi:YggT family protein
MLLSIIQIIGYLISALTFLIIIQFLFSLAIMFNIISMQNPNVSAIYKSLNMVLDPILKPIRRIMPDTGAIDFSPMVLIMGLSILQMLISGLYRDLYFG